MSEERNNAYEVEGLDLETGSLVIEIDKGILAPLANYLRRCDDRTAAPVLKAIGVVCHKSAQVLYADPENQEDMANDFNLAILEPVEDNEEDFECKVDISAERCTIQA